MRVTRFIEFMVASAIAVVAAIAVVSSSTVGSPDIGSLTRAQPRAAKRPTGHRWYASSSLWNKPIPAHPRIAQNDASLIAAWSDTTQCGGPGNCVFMAYDYTPAIWYARRHMRKVPVRIDYPHCSASRVWVPIPAGAVPDPGTEGHMVVAQVGTGIEYDFYQAQLPNRRPKSTYSGTCPTNNEWTATKVVTTNWERGNGELSTSVRGSGTPEGAGTILPRDTQMPLGSTWSHALAISYRNTCSDAMRWCPHVAPAVMEDGICTDRARCVPEGARLQLDPSINCNTWSSLHHEWQRQMCRTFQVYGAIVVDTNRGSPSIYDQWHGSLGNYTWPWLRDGNPGFPNDLLSHFRVLAWR